MIAAWGLALLGAIIGGAFAFSAYGASSDRQLVYCVVGVAWAVIPACLARAVEGINRAPSHRAPPPAYDTRCPHCADPVSSEARVCRHCGRDLPAERSPHA